MTANGVQRGKADSLGFIAFQDRKISQGESNLVSKLGKRNLVLEHDSIKIDFDAQLEAPKL
jgi:hypothetical protein